MCSDIVTSASCARARGDCRAVCLQLGVLPCVRTHRLSFNPFATSELHHHRGGGASPGDRKGHATSAQKDRYTSARGTKQKLLKQNATLQVARVVKPGTFL
jgi:hypothetical protein